MHIPDYRTWMEQPLIWTERIRSRALVWTPGADWFINDPLGHQAHLHQEASEIIYMAAGRMEILVGGTRHRVGPGDLLFMPPDKYQDYWLLGDDTVCLYVLVVPNLKHSRWKYKGFPPEAFEGGGVVADAFGDGPMPSDERIGVNLHLLAPGQTADFAVETHREKMIYVLDGRAQIQIDRLRGTMGPNDYQHVPATHRHQIANVGADSLRFIEFVCFDPTAPAPKLPEDLEV
jgi:mannose-6-phosphate isomerase-like protein (cupin superfamily)